MKYSVFGFLLGCKMTSSAKAAPLGSDIKKISDKTLTLVSTGKDAEHPFQSSEVPWSSPGQEPKFPTLTVDRTVFYQEIEGFGGAMTESSAQILDQMSPDVYEQVMNSYFDPEDGLGYTFLRVPMGSCDYTPYNSWSYDDIGRGDTDFDLDSFSIQNDVERRIPHILDAQERAGKKLKLLASPWSAPAWMKTNGAMICGVNSLWKDCTLQNDTDVQQAYANYFSNFISAYNEYDLDIWGVTVQNEPQENILTYEGMVFTPETERDFVKNFLSPTLLEDHPDTQILLLDHNKGKVVDWANVVLSDEDIQNKCPNVYGMGIHWYDGDHFDALAEVHESFPEFKVLATESTVKRDPRHNLDGGAWKNGEQYGHDMIGDFNNHVTGFIDWNLALDSHGGPLHQNVVVLDHFGADSMTICDFEEGHETSGQCIKQVFYYYVAHFSKFVKPGSVRIDWSLGDDAPADVETTAFLTPDDDIVVIVMNKGNEDASVTVVDAASGDKADISISARSMNTLVYPSSATTAAATTTTAAAAKKKEGFVFYSKPNTDEGQPEDYYMQWDWSVITTVATWHPDDSDFVDYAHSQGAIVVHGVGTDVPSLGDPDYRKQWIDDHINEALENGTDGVNIDIENNNLSKEEKEGYTALVKEAAEAFHAAIEGSQVSVDFPGYPNYELRNYDYAGIGEVADVVVIMGYDMFIWDDYSCFWKGSKCSLCNAPMKSIEFGVQEYVAMIDAEKLVLGLPWYGIGYQKIAGIPFNKGNIDLRYILNAEDEQGSEREWVGGDEQCWKMPVKGTDKEGTERVNVVYFEDSESLKPKFDLVKKYGLGGATMWNAASLEYGGGVGADEMAKIWGIYVDSLSED
ncbi:hypothetical protein TrST_g10311 [Triparma strigata]|uniref:GH18 domain-containing protein n=1 Tax=Triparma strigata TaxID=1606541 RepID=A0A9W7EQW0_9STRA|nr:hypothetical protein TrST_g10311 [Triparma strigata]